MKKILEDIIILYISILEIREKNIFKRYIIGSTVTLIVLILSYIFCIRILHSEFVRILVVYLLIILFLVIPSSLISLVCQKKENYLVNMTKEIFWGICIIILTPIICVDYIIDNSIRNEYITTDIYIIGNLYILVDSLFLLNVFSIIMDSTYNFINESCINCDSFPVRLFISLLITKMLNNLVNIVLFKIMDNTILKNKDEKKKIKDIEYLENKCKRLQLALLILAFALVIFMKKTSGYISEIEANDINNVITFFTLLILFFDKRKEWHLKGDDLIDMQ